MKYRATFALVLFLLVADIAFGQENIDSSKAIAGSARYQRNGNDTIVTITPADLRGLKPLTSEELSKTLNGRLCSCDSLNRVSSKTIKAQKRSRKSK